MNKFTEKEWVEDFQEFVKSEGAPVPENISKAIFAKVHSDLNPSPWLVFSKLLGVHLVVGTLSMAICDQFGMSPFNSGFSLSDYFMKFGHSTCMFLCGVIFIGFSMVIARSTLWPEEILVLRKSAPLQVFGLSAISLGIFAAVGAEIALTIGFLWFLGSMISGISIAKSPLFNRRMKVA